MAEDLDLAALYQQLSSKSPSKALGVSFGASPEEIRKAYRKLALVLHPDKAPPGKLIQHTLVFQVLQNVYEALSTNGNTASEPACDSKCEESSTRQESANNGSKSRGSKFDNSKSKGSAWDEGYNKRKGSAWKKTYTKRSKGFAWDEGYTKRKGSKYKASKSEDSKCKVPKSEDSQPKSSAWKQARFEKFNKRKASRRKATSRREASSGDDSNRNALSCGSSSYTALGCNAFSRDDYNRHASSSSASTSNALIRSSRNDSSQNTLSRSRRKGRQGTGVVYWGPKPKRSNAYGKKNSPFNHAPSIADEDRYQDYEDWLDARPDDRYQDWLDAQPDPAMPRNTSTCYPVKLLGTATTDCDDDADLMSLLSDGIEGCVDACAEWAQPVQAARIGFHDRAETVFPDHTWYPGIHEAKVEIDRSFPPAEPYVYNADDFPSLSEAMGV